MESSLDREMADRGAPASHLPTHPSHAVPATVADCRFAEMQENGPDTESLSQRNVRSHAAQRGDGCPRLPGRSSTLALPTADQLER